MPEPPDQGWFFSSLAQVTAAIVGFLGGFIILRLAGFMDEWRRTADNIWTTGAAYSAKRVELAKAGSNPATSPGVEYDVDRLWNELVRLLNRRRRARIPRVVSLLAAGLLVLAGVGIVWPLVELDGPSDIKQWRFVGLWVLVVLLAGIAIALEALRQLRSLKGTSLSAEIEAEYEDYMLQFERGQLVDNRDVLRRVARFVPASAAFVAFLTGAATAAGIVPVILSSWPDWLQVIFIVVSGLVFVPVGGLLGVALRDRFTSRSADG